MRRVLVRLGLLLAVLGLADASFSFLALRDEVFLGRRLPPFGDPPSPRVEAWVARLRSFDARELLPALAQHEYWRDAEELGFWRHSSFLRLGCAWRAYCRRQAPELWSDPAGEPFQVTLAIVAAFRREVLAGAQAALVVVFPRNVDLDPLVEGAAPFWSALLAELDRRGIDRLDTADVLLDEYRRERGLAAPLYVDGHLDVRGNQLVAEAVHGWLEERGLIAP